LKLETLSLKNLIYQTPIINIFNLFNLDINKYGSSYTSLSISQAITKLDRFIEVDKINYVDLNKDNLDLKIIADIFNILVKENPIKLTAEEDNGKKPTDHSFIRQLISNLKNTKQLEVIQKILGIQLTEAKEGETQKVEVVKNSLLGSIIKLIYPSMTASSESNYTNEDLVNANGFNQKFLMAVGDLITSLLESKDYTYLIQPLVLDDKVWKILDVRNIYFKNSGGKLLYQKILLEFDATDVVLNDGSIVGKDKNGIYELIFRRTSADELFFFQQVIKKRNV